MKFLLVAVNDKYIHSNPAIYSLRAYAHLYAEHIELAEYTINNRTEEIMADIFKKKPDVLGFSCYIWNWQQIRELIAICHKIMPKVPIWVGGPQVSNQGISLFDELPTLAGIMSGEGEATFLELMEYYVDKNKTLSSIRGLLLKDGATGVRALTDISKIPFLYTTLEPFANRIIYYESSRGCPFACSYCLSSIEKQVRLKNTEIVKKELQFFIDRQVTQVKFVDRTFNCNHKHAMEIWTYLKENDNNITNFHFEISADILNEEELVLLNSMRPGLVQLEIGVQSTNPVTLKEIRRVMDVERLAQVVLRIKQGQNIHQHLDLIAGLPFEDYASFQKSFNDVYAMEPDQLQLGFLKVLKGAHMYDMVEEYGIGYQDNPPYEVLFTKWLSYEELLQLKAVEEMIEMYYNSGQFSHTLPVLMKCFKDAFSFFAALANFFEKRGYKTNSPARIYRYDVLLQFAIETDPEYTLMYEELLILDLYLREKVKSRPDFAKDLLEYKEEIRTFYGEEERSSKYLPHYGKISAKQLSNMTHMEPFYYPVWNMDEQIVRNHNQEPTFVVFDYTQKDRLTGKAKIIVLENL